MPVTAQAVVDRYPLKEGESWWTCGNCGRPLAKLLANGQIQVKLRDGWLYVVPTPSATVLITCPCTDPPYREVYLLNT